MINDIVCRALTSADVPSSKEPMGLLRSDARRPDGLTLVPWSNGKMLTWDATVTDTLAPPNLPVSMYTTGTEEYVLKFNGGKSCTQQNVRQILVGSVTFIL